MPVGASGPPGKDMRQCSGRGGQRSRSHEAEDRFGGMAEASLSFGCSSFAGFCL